MFIPTTLLKRLYRLPTIMLGLMLVLAFAGFYGMKTTGDAMEEIYADRVVPLRALKDVSDAYAVYIVDASHKVQRGLMTPEQGLASIARAQATIDRQWLAYKMTPHQGQEPRLIVEAEPLRRNANGAIQELRGILMARDMNRLRQFRSTRLYQNIDPVTALISKLTIIQLNEAKRIYADAQLRTNTLIWIILIAVLAAIGIGAAARQSDVAARQAGAAARRAQERLRTIIEASADVICTVDETGLFVEISDNFEEILGWPNRSVLGRHYSDFIRDDDPDRLMHDFRDRARRGGLHSVKTEYVRPDGRMVPMSWSVVWNEEEQLYHCIGRDMTEYQALEAQAQFAQRMEAIGQLTGGVAHDFNNLLTIVIGSSETIAEHSTQPELSTLASLILKAARQGAELTRHLLAFSRRQPLAPRAFDVSDLLDGSAPLIRRALGSGLTFAIDSPARLRRAFADPTQTEAAILNLCLNARDAMPNGGKLSIGAANATLSAEEARRRPDARAGDYVAIEVRDTGTGIAPEVIDRVFEPFFTTKEVGKGSGLGLSMVYGFVQQSGGFIDLRSEPGNGTCFTLYLPAGDIRPSIGGPLPSAGEAIVRGSENILVVEDNPMVCEHVRVQLDQLGYQVMVASSGAEALSIIERRDDIDLLFSDIVMPGGMNGRELGERAAARLPGLRILYTSGFSRDALTQDGRLVEGVTLLSKPYSKRELAEKVRKVLDEIP